MSYNHKKCLIISFFIKKNCGKNPRAFLDEKMGACYTKFISTKHENCIKKIHSITEVILLKNVVGVFFYAYGRCSGFADSWRYNVGH